jgi:hypothetical protein
MNDYHKNQFKFMPNTNELSLFTYYKLRDEIFKLEQKLIRLANFQLNSMATPNMNELLLISTTLGCKWQLH